MRVTSRPPSLVALSSLGTAAIVGTGMWLLLTRGRSALGRPVSWLLATRGRRVGAVRRLALRRERALRRRADRALAGASRLPLPGAERGHRRAAAAGRAAVLAAHGAGLAGGDRRGLRRGRRPRQRAAGRSLVSGLVLAAPARSGTCCRSACWRCWAASWARACCAWRGAERPTIRIQGEMIRCPIGHSTARAPIRCSSSPRRRARCASRRRATR